MDVLGILLLFAALLLTSYNFIQSYTGGETAERDARRLELNIQNTRLEEPDPLLSSYPVQDPDVTMPEYEVSGEHYIGLLEIEAISLKLPVISQWSYPALKVAPARYAGSVYQDNLVIAGHNYTRHFGHLKDLKIGDTVFFIDMDGNSFRYRVSEIEILKPTEVDTVLSGAWDLTLFTCTLGGTTRITVRCEKTETERPLT